MKRLTVIPLAFAALLAGGATRIVQDQCGPFTDVTPAFCPYVLEMYYLGITAGTSPTTYSQDSPMTRGQAAVFVSKSLNQALARSSRRAALGQWWQPQNSGMLGLTPACCSPFAVTSDGSDLWVPAYDSATVGRVRASDGRLLETWTNATWAYGVLVAMGRVFVTAHTTAPNVPLYMIDPTQPAGPVATVAQLGDNPLGIAFDGQRIWTANQNGSVSIVTPGATPPWPTSTVSTGFNSPTGILFDGSNIWVTDAGAGTLLKLDSAANIIRTITVGASPRNATFDGANIWVPNANSNSVTVARAADGSVLATLIGNGLSAPLTAAFDGQRVLVTDFYYGVSLWRAADLAPIGSFATPVNTFPYGACSDGTAFWVTFDGLPGSLARF